MTTTHAEYLLSRHLAHGVPGVTFAALIMAAMRRADSNNSAMLRGCWPATTPAAACCPASRHPGHHPRRTSRRTSHPWSRQHQHSALNCARSVTTCNARMTTADGMDPESDENAEAIRELHEDISVLRSIAQYCAVLRMEECALERKLEQATPAAE